MSKLTQITGYVRDFVVAILGVLMILNVLGQELAGGILLVVMTGLALGLHVLELYKGGSDAQEGN